MIRQAQPQGGSADTANLLAQTKLSSMLRPDPDPDQDIIFTFDTPVSLTVTKKYLLELNTYAGDSRAYYRNRWVNAVDTASWDWYLKLGLGVGGQLN